MSVPSAQGTTGTTPSIPTFSMAKPIMGGIVQRAFSIVFVGGIPKADWSGPETPYQRPKTPLAYRHDDPGKEAKTYRAIVQAPDGLSKIGKGTSAANVLHIVTKIDEHVKNTGLESIFHVAHPTNSNKMISVITHYLTLTIKHVEAELKRVKPYWDFYDSDNDDMAKTLIKSLLDEATTREIHARDPTDQMPAAVLWMHAMANRAGINSDQIEKLQETMKTWSPLKIAGQNINKFAVKVRELKLELDKVNGYQHTITKKILLNLSHCTPTRFTTKVYAKMEGIEEEIVAVKTMSYADAEQHMVSKDFDVESILTIFEELYKEMMDSNDWSPARNRSDKGTPPEANLASLTKEEFCQLVDKKAEEKVKAMTQDSDTDSEKKSDGSSNKTKKWKRGCCNECGQEDHKEAACPNKNLTPVDKFPDYSTSAPEVVKCGTKYKFRCDTCKRYTLSHVTTQHKAKAKKTDNSEKKSEDTEVNLTDASGVQPWFPWSA